MIDSSVALDSPGAVTRARSQTEDALTPVVRRAVATFLRDVRLAALDDPLAFPATVVAAAHPSSDRFTVGRVSEAWGSAVDVILVATLSELGNVPATVRDDYAVRLTSRMLNDATPDEAYAAAMAVLADGQARGWSRRKTVNEMQRAFAPDPSDPRRFDSTVPDYDWQARARRIARTEATSAHNTAVNVGLDQQGFTRKRWVSHHDNRVRGTHLAADGQTVPTAQPFVVGGEALQYPGDPNGSPAETASCRCVTVGTRWRSTPLV